MDVEHVALDQELVYRGVEMRVVHHVVDMGVNVIVHPARGNREEVKEIGTARIAQKLLSD